MCYSSAIFKDYEEDIRPGATSNLESLEDAQLRKMRWGCLVQSMATEYLKLIYHRAILKKLRIQPGDRVLEIGENFPSTRVYSLTGIQAQDLVLYLSLRLKLFPTAQSTPLRFPFIRQHSQGKELLKLDSLTESLSTTWTSERVFRNLSGRGRSTGSSVLK